MKKYSILYLVFISFLSFGSLMALPSEKKNNETAQELLEYGYDVLQITNAGDNILHQAVKKGNLDAAKLALEYGISPSRTNKAGDIPLHIAADKGFVSLIDLLIESGSDINVKNILGQTPYHKALARGNSEIMNLLIKSGYQPGDEFEDYLYAHGSNIHSTDKAGNGPMHRLAKAKNLELMREVLEHGFDANVSNNKGETPFIFAIKNRDLEMVQLLLGYDHEAHYADLSAMAKLGWTAGLRLLFEEEDSCYKNFINLHNDKGIAPLHYACAAGSYEAVQLLIENGADFNQLTYSEYHYGPNDPIHWSSYDWDTFSDFSRVGDLESYTQGSGYIHPVVSPLTIVKNLHPDQTDLIELLVELGAMQVYHFSLRGEMLDHYLQ